MDAPGVLHHVIGRGIERREISLRAMCAVHERPLFPVLWLIFLMFLHFFENEYEDMGSALESGQFCLNSRADPVPFTLWRDTY